MINGTLVGRHTTCGAIVRNNMTSGNRDGTKPLSVEDRLRRGNIARSLDSYIHNNTGTSAVKGSNTRALHNNSLGGNGHGTHVAGIEVL